MAARDPPGSTVRRVHCMPFGTEVRPDGEARFRLWAPAVPAVTLCLEGTAERAMTPAGGGWFAATAGARAGPAVTLCLEGTAARAMPPAGGGWFEATAAARTGARYRFRLPDGQVVPDPASRRQPDVHGPSEV